jgi:hypothetical protein
MQKGKASANKTEQILEKENLSTFQPGLNTISQPELHTTRRLGLITTDQPTSTTYSKPEFNTTS